ncbi:MAG: hypothetical protein AAFO84_05810 [Cyanobacteria bacterium J06598_1]
MSEPLEPQALKELAAGYVLGDLSSEEAEQFHQLMQEVPALSLEVAALQAALHMMPYGLSEQRPRKGLRSQMLTATQIATRQDSAKPTNRPSQKVSRRRRFQAFGGIAAGIMMIVGGSKLVNHQTATSRSLGPQHNTRTLLTQATQVEQVWAGFLQLQEDHNRALNHPQGPADFTAEQAKEVTAQLQNFQTTTAALPMLPSTRAKLLGGSDCQFGTTLGLRLSFQVNTASHTPSSQPDQIVSAYQLELNGEQFPQFLSSYITMRQPDGTSIVLWREESYLYALVAEMPPAELNSLAHAVGHI